MYWHNPHLDPKKPAPPKSNPAAVAFGIVMIFAAAVTLIIELAGGK